MKKFFAALLFLVHGLSSSGMTLHLHYCCGKLKSVTIGFVAIEKHKCSKDNGTFGCCKFVIQNIKAKDEQVVAAEVQTPTKACIELHNLSLWQPFRCNSLQVIAAESYRSPPSVRSVPINIYNCVYRI